MNSKLLGTVANVAGEMFRPRRSDEVAVSSSVVDERRGIRASGPRLTMESRRKDRRQRGKRAGRRRGRVQDTRLRRHDETKFDEEYAPSSKQHSNEEETTGRCASDIGSAAEPSIRAHESPGRPMGPECPSKRA